METLLIILFVYLAYIFTWFVINIVFYFFSIAFKKKTILNVLTLLGGIVLNIFNFLVGIGFLWLAISLLLNREFLWFILLVFFGFGLIGGLLSFLQLPFVFITTYFSNKLDDIDFNEDIVSAELVDEHNKVVAKIEGDTAISRRLAIYFVLFFAFNLLSIFIFPDDEQQLMALDYIINPTLQILGGTIILGIPYLIYHKIKHKSFLPDDKRYFFIQVWKLNLIFFSILSVLVMIFLSSYS